MRFSMTRFSSSGRSANIEPAKTVAALLSSGFSLVLSHEGVPFSGKTPFVAIGPAMTPMMTDAWVVLAVAPLRTTRRAATWPCGSV